MEKIKNYWNGLPNWRVKALVAGTALLGAVGVYHFLKALFTGFFG